MKTLEQLYQEIQSNDELKEQLTTALRENKIEEFLKAQDCDATAKDVFAFMNSLKEGAIADDDLDKVAGGNCSTYTCGDTCGFDTYSYPCI